MDQFFHSLTEAAKDDAALAGLRSFVGNGKLALDTPGLKAVRRVIIDGVELPAQITEKYLDESGEKTDSVVVPMLKVVQLEGGRSALLRGVKSNDGIWQS